MIYGQLSWLICASRLLFWPTIISLGVRVTALHSQRLAASDCRIHFIFLVAGTQSGKSERQSAEEKNFRHIIVLWEINCINVKLFLLDSR